jgi:DNA modification methylase
MEHTMIEIYNEDCLETMKRIPDNYIDLTVTSPPYDNLRNYNGIVNQWNENKWKEIIKELFRVTKSGGVVVWIVGDATVKGSETGTSFKQALWAIDCGFKLHDTMIYEKLGYMPQTHKRQDQTFEYMFIWVKDKIKTFNPKLKLNKTGGKIIQGRNRSRSDSLEKIHGYGKQIKKYGYDINIWSYATGSINYGGFSEAKKHPAVFPIQLALDHIKTWSNENDIVFDPFLGSGTSAQASYELKRKFIGVEMDKEYFEISKARIEHWTKS